MVATQVRFFQQQGFSTTAAVTSGAVVSAVSFIVKGTLFVIAIPVAWRSFHFGNSLHQGGHAKVLALILVVVCVSGAVMAAVLAVPRWRRRVSGKLRPKLATARDNFTRLASQPGKCAQLFGGQVVAQLAVALALGAALHAFGAHLSLAALIIAVTTAGLLASASPAGGGPGRRRGRPDPSAHRRRHRQERRDGGRVRSASFLRLPPARHRLVHPHVDAQEGIPVTCPGKDPAGPVLS